MRRYIIERGRMGRGDKGAFKVSVEGEVHGGYLSEYAALLDAVDAAQAAGKSGEPSQVLTRTKDGNETVQWTYGADPYPYEGRRAAADAA